MLGCKATATRRALDKGVRGRYGHVRDGAHVGRAVARTSSSLVTGGGSCG